MSQHFKWNWDEHAPLYTKGDLTQYQLPSKWEISNNGCN